MLSLAKLIGPSRVEQVRLWSSSAGKYAASAIVLGLFVSEWKVVVEKIPLYGGKFKEEN
ncbi:ubiquinol-cytochrome c reductase [Brachionus plicatilis]|uniref:Ubiquinol-cytochrome c reductase n=1 Tax=Brachionus plicatilis TaxID=10195 RepID=A0A3M7SQ46_BRAPC|nr:ubiquinol-cytochrome c reductase [Brachionus plicatilis]